MNLVDVFDRSRFWGNKRNRLFNALKFYGAWNYAVTLLANALLPLYFKYTSKRPSYSLSSAPEREQKVVVSLTSFPKRLNTLWLVLETMLRQTMLPNEIRVYLTQSQISDESALPKSLLKLKSRGVSFIFCPDEIRSHTKYFYALQEFSNDLIITIDDDLFYRSDLIAQLLRTHEQYPKAIIANWAKEMLPQDAHYYHWPDVKQPQLSHTFCLLGVSGVLYPPQSLPKEAFDVEEICQRSLTADDIWLSYMAQLHHTPIYFTGYEYHHLPVRIAHNETLLAENRSGGNQICVERILDKYGSRLNLGHLCI